MVRLVWPNPFQQEEPYFHTLNSGSITGILCLYDVANKFALWNPSNDEFRILPPSPNDSPHPGLRPAVVLHGFGYDHVNDDYKLIRLVTFFVESDYDLPFVMPEKDPLWEIYSLRNNSWRTIDGDEPTCSLEQKSSGYLLYIDGMCHWWGEGINGTHEGYFLSTFVLSNESFFATPASIDIDFDLVFYLLVLNGYIGLVSWNFWGTTFHISILGELGVKESWTKLFVVGPLPPISHPIGAGKNGKIFFKKEDGELVLVDLSTQLIKELGINGEADSHILVYKENLHPIGGINNL